MKMNALVKSRPERGLWLQSVDVPVAKEGEALIRVKKSAICGTDLHIYNWDEWSQHNVKTPTVIGHEFVGEIVEINGKSSAFKVGDLVCAEGHVTCGTCRNCRGGRLHLCPNTRGIGINRDGIFAEYAAIPLSNLWLCDRGIPEDMFAIFDPFGNAAHTALTYDVIGEDVLVCGAGPIGIMAAAICLHNGARNVVITDIAPYRLELAKKVCPRATVCNAASESLEDVQHRLGMREGFDVGLEMSGSRQGFCDMIDNMICGGKIALLGIQKNDVAINWEKVIFHSLSLKGIYGRQIFETWHKMTTMLQSGLDISAVVTHKFDYKDFEKGFELMQAGKCGKVILNWSK